MVISKCFARSACAGAVLALAGLGAGAVDAPPRAALQTPAGGLSQSPPALPKAGVRVAPGLADLMIGSVKTAGSKIEIAVRNGCGGAAPATRLGLSVSGVPAGGKPGAPHAPLSYFELDVPPIAGNGTVTVTHDIANDFATKTFDGRSFTVTADATKLVKEAAEDNNEYRRPATGPDVSAFPKAAGYCAAQP